MHALTGYDITGYPYMVKATALIASLAENINGLANVLREVNMTPEDLLEVASQYFTALYFQHSGTSLESANFRLFIKTKWSP